MPPVVDAAFARHHAAEWIEAWNSHDLDRILSHYADDFEIVIEVAEFDANGKVVRSQAIHGPAAGRPSSFDKVASGSYHRACGRSASRS